MKRIGWLISKYLLSTIIPYFVFSWLLLTVILFVQQASRYSDIYFNVNLPSHLVWQITLALLPNVIAFTCPMAMLVGTIIGLTKMQGDNELVAIRAAGVGNLQIAVPIMAMGVLMSGFAFLVNLEGVPLAASLVRNVALQAAIRKLESPIEPGVFNTEVAGYTIYVKGGDLETRTWKNIFVYQQDPENFSLRLITSRNGRIDTTGQSSELVLENATITTLPTGGGNYVSESLGEIRLSIRTKRSELIDRLSLTELRPDELGLQQLSEYAAAKEGNERVEAQILWQRRVILSITPFLFCVLGTALVLRFNRGGKGFGIATALGILIGFYLLAFLGEQLARAGTISVLAGSLIPIAGTVAAVIWFGSARKLEFVRQGFERLIEFVPASLKRARKLQTRNVFVDLTTGLRDFDLIWNLIVNFILTILFLASIFFIFTAFELWKFAGIIDGGSSLLARYLFYLSPFVYLQIAPSAAMIATLATFVIKARNNEIVTWTAARQSIYRLLVPCLLMTMLLGTANWLVQEKVLPGANKLQDETRELIRNRGVPVVRKGTLWAANDQRIYSFRLASDNELTETDSLQMRSSETSDNGRGRPPASDNGAQVCKPNCVRDLTIYEFDAGGERLQTILRARQAVWVGGRLRLLGPVERTDLSDDRVTSSMVSGFDIDDPTDLLTALRPKPLHMNSTELERQIGAVDSDVERRTLEVGLQKKYATPFLPFVMALFTAPFALNISRRGKVATVGYAVLLWLIFTGTSTLFEQFGLSGQLSPELAVFSPLFIFGSLGVFLVSKVRT